MGDIILFLKVEAIEVEKQKKSGKYSVHLEIEPVKQATLEKTLGTTFANEAVEINIDERFVRKLQNFEAFHKTQASIQNISIAETLDGQLEWEKTLGIEIYQIFFPENIAENFEACLKLLHQGRTNKLTLVISSPIAWILDIPFEMMRMEKDDPPISLSHERFQLIHSIEISLPTFTKSILAPMAPPLKLLFVSALPINFSEEERLIELEKEQELLINSLGELISKKQLIVEFLDIATLEEIESALKDGEHHVVHFSGHGGYNEYDSRETGVLYLEDELGNVKAATGKELAMCLKKFTSIRLVVFSACETAHAHESGVAGAMLKEGIPAVLGMRYPVNDNAATQFTSCLYDDICKGKPLDQAMFMARQALYDQNVENIKTRQQNKQDALIASQWMIPFIFMNQNLIRLIDHSKKTNYINHFFQIPAPLVQGAKYVGRGFIGRHKELLDLYRLFREGQRNVCIYGQGGTGKTTLAVRFVHNYEKGAYRLLRFDNEVTEETILSRLAEEASEFLGESIIAFVKSPDYEPTEKLNLLIEDFLSQQKIILLFDNFEENQVAFAEKNKKKVYQRNIHSKSLKELLMHLCKNIKAPSYILFTTRYLFPEPEIVSLNLGELRFSDTFKLLNRFPKLVELSTQEKRHVYDKLGGHPRAIELLESCISHENIGWKNVSEKFQEVEFREFAHDLMLDMLWEQLTDDEKKTLLGGSVFRGLTDLNGLKAVTGQNKGIIKQSVESLNVLSLIYMEENKFYFYHITTTFVQTLKMNKKQVMQFHKKAAEYFDKLENGEGKRYIEDLFEARWHYLMATEWNLASKVTFQLKASLTLYGHQQLSFELLKEIEKKDLDNKNREIALSQLGELHQHFGEYEQALEYYKNSLEIANKINDEEGITINLNNIGAVSLLKGDYEEALSIYEQILENSKNKKNIIGIAASLHQLGMINENKGEWEKALNFYKESLEICEITEDKKEISANLLHIGIIHERKGNYDEALKYCKKAIEIKEAIGDIMGIAGSLHELGVIYLWQGNYDKALKNFKDSMKIFEDNNASRELTESMVQIAMTYHNKSYNEEALKWFGRALELSEKIGDPIGIASSCEGIGNILFSQSKFEYSLKWFERSLETREKVGDINGIAAILNNIGVIEEMKGHYNKALKRFKMSLKTSEKIGDNRGTVGALHQIGTIYLRRGEYNKSMEQFLKAVKIAKETGIHREMAGNLHQMAVIFQIQGDFKEALKINKEVLEIFQKIGDHDGIAHSLYQLGMILQEKEEFDLALKQYKRALNIFKSIGNDFKTASIIGQMGVLFFDKKEYKRALKHFTKAYLTLKNLKVPDIKIVIDNIRRTRIKMTKKEFNGILKEFNLSVNAFRQKSKTKNEGEKLLMKIASQTVSAKEKGEDQKEEMEWILNDLMRKIPDDHDGYEITFSYISMLLAYLFDEDLEEYRQRVPNKMYEIFEQAVIES